MDRIALIEPPEQKLFAENTEKTQDNKNPNSIPWRVYHDYFSAHVHWIFVLMLALVIIGSHSLYILSDWWLARWYVVLHKVMTLDVVRARITVDA